MDILIVCLLAWMLGRRARAKGLPPWPYRLMLVVLWFFGEFAGFMVGMLIKGMPSKIDVESLAVYTPYALIGAAIGACIAFIIVGLLPHAPETRRNSDEEPEDDDMPWDRAPVDAGTRFSDRHRGSLPDRSADGNTRDGEPRSEGLRPPQRPDRD